MAVSKTVTAAKSAAKKDVLYSWEGIDKTGKRVRGEMRAAAPTFVESSLRRQGIRDAKVRRQRSSGGTIKTKDITLFTRQLATMMKSGVPLLQAFDIVGKGHSNPAVGRLLVDIKTEVETGSSLNQAFRKYPLYFDPLFCNLVAAGEAAGILDALLDRLASYREKMQKLLGKIKAALFYPVAVLVAAFIITAVIMIFVIPAFKDLFSGFGAGLPYPTQVVIMLSDIFVSYWYAIFGGIGGAIYGFFYVLKRNKTLQGRVDRIMLRLPLFGEIVRKATIARWTRTLSTMFAAGVPLVEALDSVGGASGNLVYVEATQKIRTDVSTGTSLTVSMQNAEVFPNMVLQMVQIGEEAGSLDSMLGKVADFYEEEVDTAVEALSSLMEPIIIVVLGTLIGGLVIAMYLPIFKMGQIVGQ